MANSLDTGGKHLVEFHLVVILSLAVVFFSCGRQAPTKGPLVPEDEASAQEEGLSEFRPIEEVQRSDFAAKPLVRRRNLVAKIRELSKLRTIIPTKSGVMGYVEPLIGLLGYQNAVVNVLAREALEEIGEPKAVDTNENWRVRSGAAFILGRIGDPRAVEKLIEALEIDSHGGGGHKQHLRWA